MLSKQTGAKLLVDCLVKHNVKYVFGIPGARIDAVFDALLDSPIKVILCRHEQNAAFMAGVYGRLTGNPGVVIVTAGPGVTNLATGLLTATTEGDPVVAIGGSVARNMKLKKSYQFLNNIKFTESITKASMEVATADEIAEIIENAFRIATTPHGGAVFISLPQDVATEKTSISAPSTIPLITYGTAPGTHIHQAANIINTAKHPVMLLGLEATRPDNTSAIRNMLNKSELPTVLTYQAAGVIPRELIHCFMGRVGVFKNQPGDKLLDRADVVITIGFNPVEYNPDIWNENFSKKIIHINYHPADAQTHYLPTLEILGNIAGNVEKLNLQLAPRKPNGYNGLIKESQKILTQKIASGANYSGPLTHPLRFIHDLRKTMDDNTIVISDVGSHHLWLARYFFCYQPRHLLFSNGQLTSGVALPWAIAAKLARPEHPVISISGDGGFLMSANEVETAVRENLSLVHIIWCDGSYNMVAEQQKIKYKRTSAVHFGKIDFVKYAESFGAKGFRVNHSDEFVDILKKSLTLTGPVLIEIEMDYSDNSELFKISHESLGN